jgi:hypothetical protein
MNRTITSTVSSLVLGLSLALAGCAGAAPNAAAPNAVPASASVLDGSTYDVVLDMPGEDPIKDTLTFNAGRFESSVCTGFGFPKWSEYRAQRDADAIAFALVTHHPDGGSVEWNGSVKGSSVTGTAKRTMNGKTVSGSFKGNAR